MCALGENGREKSREWVLFGKKVWVTQLCEKIYIPSNNLDKWNIYKKKIMYYILYILKYFKNTVLTFEHSTYDILSIICNILS